MKLSDYRIEGGKVDLKDWDTDDRGGLTREEAEPRGAELLERLSNLQERLYAEGRQSLLVVLQARDAGGKDGTIKHVFSSVNPQGVHVVSFKAPSAEELAHDFLWRIHARVPAAGHITIFNRSHYEDVLVPRVHKWVDPPEVERRFALIRAFEAMLIDRGTRVLKFYLHISKAEQLERFQKRIENPEKRWKFNPGDLEERQRWSDYTKAYEDAIAATATPESPWFVVPADRKWFRNLLVSEAIVKALDKMNPQYPKVTFDPKTVELE